MDTLNLASYSWDYAGSDLFSDWIDLSSPQLVSIAAKLTGLTNSAEVPADRPKVFGLIGYLGVDPPVAAPDGGVLDGALGLAIGLTRIELPSASQAVLSRIAITSRWVYFSIPHDDTFETANPSYHIDFTIYTSL